MKRTDLSEYMRKMQRKSAAKRWAGLSKDERGAKMAGVAKARWAKTAENRAKSKGQS